MYFFVFISNLLKLYLFSRMQNQNKQQNKNQYLSLNQHQNTKIKLWRMLRYTLHTYWLFQVFYYF